MKISKIKIIFFFLFYAGQSHAQSDRTRLEIDTDKGCKYAEFVTSDRIQIRKQLSISWTGYCENGYISGEGTLTLKGIEADTTVIKTTFSNGLENGQGESKNESPKGRSFFIGNWKDGMRTNGMLEIYPQGASPFKYECEFSDGNITASENLLVMELYTKEAIKMVSQMEKANGYIQMETLMKVKLKKIS